MFCIKFFILFQFLKYYSGLKNHNLYLILSCLLNVFLLCIIFIQNKSKICPDEYEEFLPERQIETRHPTSLRNDFNEKICYLIKHAIISICHHDGYILTIKPKQYGLLLHLNIDLLFKRIF